MSKIETIKEIIKFKLEPFGFSVDIDQINRNGRMWTEPPDWVMRVFVTKRIDDEHVFEAEKEIPMHRVEGMSNPDYMAHLICDETVDSYWKHRAKTLK